VSELSRQTIVQQDGSTISNRQLFALEQLSVDNVVLASVLFKDIFEQFAAEKKVANASE